MLLATGAVGGMDVALGVFALLLVRHETGSHLLGALAFGIGFFGLILAKSELFTENFLIPVGAVVAHRGSVSQMLRLWGGTLAMNLAGGWVILWITLAAVHEIAPVAVAVGEHLPSLGIGWTSLASGILAGALMTLLTWMERSTEAVVAKLVAALAIAFLLVGGQLNHVIVGALEMFAGLHAGAPFGYADAFGVIAWATLANLVGGIGLVTVLRFIQVGRREIIEEQREADSEQRQELAG